MWVGQKPYCTVVLQGPGHHIFICSANTHVHVCSPPHWDSKSPCSHVWSHCLPTVLWVSAFCPLGFLLLSFWFLPSDLLISPYCPLGFSLLSSWFLLTLRLVSVYCPLGFCPLSSWFPPTLLLVSASSTTLTKRVNNSVNKTVFNNTWKKAETTTHEVTPQTSPDVNNVLKLWPDLFCGLVLLQDWDREPEIRLLHRPALLDLVPFSTELIWVLMISFLFLVVSVICFCYV